MNLRPFLGPLPCLVGFHDWGEPMPMNRTTLSGERTEDGWDHETSGPERVVVQYCRCCSRSRDRHDLDWERLRGRYADASQSDGGDSA